MTNSHHLILGKALFILSIWITSFGCAEFENGTWTDPETSHFQVQSSADFPAPDAMRIDTCTGYLATMRLAINSQNKGCLTHPHQPMFITNVSFTIDPT